MNLDQTILAVIMPDSSLNNQMMRFHETSGHIIQVAPLTHLTDTGHMSLGQVAAPEGILELWADDAHTILSITDKHATDFDPQIQFLTDDPATVKCSMGVDAADDSLRINMGTGVGGATHFIMDTNGGIKCQNSTDSTTAYQWLDADGGTPILNIDSTNERVGIGTPLPVGKATVAGDVVIHATGDEGANRTAKGGTDPALRVYSADETQALDYIEMYHDQTTGIIKTGNSINVIANQIKVNAIHGQWNFKTNGVNTLFMDLNRNFDQGVFGISSFEIGNQMILTNLLNYNHDHDHVPQDNPTLYIHSDTDPDGDNTEWLSLSHDKTNAVFGLGSGAYTFPDGNVGIGEISPETLVEMTSTAPYFTYHNSTEENTDGGRESIMYFKGEKTDTSEHTLASITVAHDGSGDDRLGYMSFAANHDDADTPTEVFKLGYGGVQLMKADPYLNSDTNFFLGVDAGGDGNLSHGSGNEGWYNIGIGSGSLKAITTGELNVAIGYQSLLTLEGGDRNFGLGASSLAYCVNGISNVAIGYQALNVYDDNNSVAIGSGSSRSNTSGEETVSIGVNTLYRNVTGRRNTIIGMGSAYGVSNNSFSNSTYVGYKSGYSIEIGSNNGFYGYQCGDNVTTADNCLLIGYDIDAPSATTNGQMSLGNLIFGTGLDGTGTDISSGNVGIKEPAPQDTLEINGTLLVKDALKFTQDDGNEFLDSLNDGYMDYRATDGHRFNILIEASGDVVFTGAGSGLPLGCISGLDETITCTDQNTYYQVTFDTAGPSNLTTVSIANEEITVLKAGIYTIAVTACFHSAVSRDFELLVQKNDGNTALEPHLFQTTAVANQVENTAGSCLVSLDANDRIELWIRCTDAAGQDAVLDHVSLTCAMVGG